jgi:hypothetical protein
MSRTATFDRLPSHSLFARFFSQIAGLLDRVARVAARNGDVPTAGL